MVSSTTVEMRSAWSIRAAVTQTTPFYAASTSSTATVLVSVRLTARLNRGSMAPGPDRHHRRPGRAGPPRPAHPAATPAGQGLRIANRIHRRDQPDTAQLLEWLAERGLSPHGHSHQPGDHLRRSDLERLSQLDGATLDLAFVKVMTSRDRPATKLAATEARGGSVSAIRQLAHQLLAEQQARAATLPSWRRAWSKSHASRPPTPIRRHP